ncbi:unnamed protein product [Polarella glacialis]|uniref:CHASE domain-containing protein n=1 Tax=Polarella glacialis TaxID=89957 RepID=A0A813EZV1_POLGL|nr:unnamed protein product [Polarella glacialis]
MPPGLHDEEGTFWDFNVVKKFESQVCELRLSSRRRVPTLSMRIVVKALLGMSIAALVCCYSAYRIVTSENDFYTIQHKVFKEYGDKITEDVRRQLVTSVSSTKALAALVQLDAGKTLLSPLEAKVHEVVSASVAVAAAAVSNASLTAQEAITAQKQNATTSLISNLSLAGFNIVAESLIDSYKGITNLQLAPSGVVSVIYPLASNEAAIGHDLFNIASRQAGARLAIKSRKITFIGPITLLQNGLSAIIARYPIFIENRNYRGQVSEFPTWWGFATMLCTLDDLFASTMIGSASALGTSFVFYAHGESSETFLFASEDVPGRPAKVEFDPEKQWLQYAKSQQPVITGFTEPDLNVDWQMLIWPSEGILRIAPCQPRPSIS